MNVSLKKKIYLYANSTTQRCPDNIFKTFPIEEFFHLPPVSCTLNGECLCEFLKIFETALMGYSRAWGNWFVKKLKSRISMHYLFNSDVDRLKIGPTILG
jgi:hypothetical protein